MATATHLGCPRLGSQRELKWSLEKYWRGTANAEALHRLGRDLRQALQQRLNLPLFPTTTIGSFPQTPEVRQARSQCKAGKLDAVAYEAFLKQEIACAIRVQEEIGLDVLVHGEFERNDMVEYFGEQLTGFVTTRHGWVQSYGSRGIKPPSSSGWGFLCVLLPFWCGTTFLPSMWGERGSNLWFLPQPGLPLFCGTMPVSPSASPGAWHYGGKIATQRRLARGVQAPRHQRHGRRVLDCSTVCRCTSTRGSSRMGYLLSAVEDLMYGP